MIVNVLDHLWESDGNPLNSHKAKRVLYSRFACNFGLHNIIECFQMFTKIPRGPAVNQHNKCTLQHAVLGE